MAVLSNFHKALKPSGLLLMHTPNYKQTRFFNYFENQHVKEHIRTGFAIDGLIKDICASGFEIELARYTFGPIGNLAWELYHLTDEYKLYFKLLILPLLKLMMYYDTGKNHKVGNGLFFMARKPFGKG
jgi:hypothetical protein